MAQEITYELIVEVDGLNISEGVAGGKGAGEALRQLEKDIRQMNYAASSTNVKVKTLTKQE